MLAFGTGSINIQKISSEHSAHIAFYTIIYSIEFDDDDDDDDEMRKTHAETHTQLGRVHNGKQLITAVNNTQQEEWIFNVNAKWE